MSKFKNWFLKNFLPITYSIKELTNENSGEKIPTVRDILRIKADNNYKTIPVYAKLMVDDIYDAWLKSIEKKSNLYLDANGEFAGSNGYEFDVVLNTENNFLKKAMEMALDEIISDHPDIFYKTTFEKPDNTRITFYYKNCLDDHLPINCIKGNFIDIKK